MIKHKKLRKNCIKNDKKGVFENLSRKILVPKLIYNKKDLRS